MISGEKKIELNDFELELEALLGDASTGPGITYHFYTIYDTFLRAEKALKAESQNFLEELQTEEPDIQWSMFNSLNHIAYPSIQTLYDSFFIVIHSELERIWKEIIQLYNKYHQPQLNKDEKLNHNFSFKLECFINEVVKKYEILFTYNYIRNGIVHAKNAKEGPFYACEEYVRNNHISNIEIIDEDEEFKFLIEDLSFGKKYADLILEFIQAIIDKSVQKRLQKY